MNKYNINNFDYIIKKILLLTDKKRFLNKGKLYKKNMEHEEKETNNTEKISEFYLSLIQNDINYYPYVFDNIAFITKYYSPFLNDKALNNFLKILCLFNDELDYISDSHESSNIEKKDNDYNVNNDDHSDDILKFLFYNNLDSYYNMKYILKRLYYVSELQFKIANFQAHDFDNKLKILVKR